MKKLTNYQKNFILNYFFKKSEYPGWVNIAELLLNDGTCIVAGTDCIWKGGIGNFIKTENAVGLIDCVVYKFDLDVFLDSLFFSEVLNLYISELSAKKRELENEYNDIISLYES